MKEPPPSAPDPEALAAAIQRGALQAAVEVLEARGEPLIFDWLHQTIYQRLSQAGLLRQAMAAREEGFSPLDFVREHVDAALQRGLREGPLVGMDGESVTEGEPRHRLWWLREPRYTVEPLGDRVERAVYELLEGGLPLGPSAVYSRFPGLLTPEADLVEACLASYGREILSGQWGLRLEDRRAWRERERAEMIARHLEKLKPKYKVILYLYYYKELSRNEVAQKLGISPRRVSERVNYAQKLLKKMMKK